MSDDKHKCTEFTTEDIPADQILEAAKGHVPVALIIGLDEDGELYFASSTGATDTIRMVLAKANAYAEKHL